MLNEKARVLVAKVDNPKAKLKYRLEAIKHKGVYVGINTSLPNGIIYEAIKEKKILNEDRIINYFLIDLLSIFGRFLIDVVAQNRPKIYQKINQTLD